MYKIYKIVDNTNDNVYIGITTQKYLSRRLNGHKWDKTCVSRDIIKNNDYRIELIEETDDKTRERYWIENTDCINQVIPGKTRAEWLDENKEKIVEYRKQYYKENKERLAEKIKDNNRIRCKWQSSMGGRPCRNNMSLLKIDVNLFN